MPYPKSMKLIHGIVILDEEGRSIVKNYYTDDFASKAAQESFEKKMHEKCHVASAGKNDAQISLLDKYIVVSRSGADVTIYFITPETENELIVVEAIEGFYEALRIYFKDKVDRSEILKHVPYVYLVMDEMCDAGVLCETDAAIINQRVEMKA